MGPILQDHPNQVIRWVIKLVKRYLSDMDKEESTLIANTQRLQDLKRRVSEITEIVIVRVRGVQATADQLWMCAKRFGIPAKT